MITLLGMLYCTTLCGQVAGRARLPVRPQLLAKLIQGAAGPPLLHVNNTDGRLVADPLYMGDAPDLFDDLQS